MPTIGIAPENAGRAQRKACQCQRKDRREPQEREIQRAAHIGTDRSQLRVQRVAAVLPLIAGDGQRQGIGPAGKVQTADQTAGRCRCSLPAPALAGCRAGLIRGSHIKLEQDIFLLGGITVRQRDQPVQLQVIDLKAEIRKFQHGAVPLQRQRCSRVRVVCQVRPQVHRRIAAGCQPAQVADKYLRPKAGRQQQDDRSRSAQPLRQRAAQAEPADNTAGKPLHGQNGRQTESVKVSGQARAGPDADRPQPDKRRDARPGITIGAGGFAVLDAGGQKGEARRKGDRKKYGQNQHKDKSILHCCSVVGAAQVRPAALPKKVISV